MTPADKHAIASLADELARADRTHTDVLLPIEMARTLLSLVREPVASVEGHVSATLDSGDMRIELAPEGRFFRVLTLAAFPGAKVGAKVRIDVHAVDAGEEK